LLNKKKNHEPGLLVYTCNSSTWEAETGGLQIQGQPGLHSESLSQKKKRKEKKKKKNDSHRTAELKET
jgi:hypothetical protein